MALIVDIKKKLGNFCLDVHFKAENEVLGLLGPSGCGKSMTLKCIAGIAAPDEGQIILDGNVLFDSEKKINLSPQKRHVGLLFQNYALFPNMNVYQNIRTGLWRDKRSRRDTDMAVKKIMEKLYISDLQKHMPSQLSGGQQQRVALARILVSDPRILMLDEPFASLDAYLRWEVETQLARILKDYKKTVLFVSHDKDEVYRLCPRVCAMTRGYASEPQNAAEMFEHPSTLSQALLSGCKNISKARPLSGHSLIAEEWGICLETARQVPKDLTAVGIHGKYLKPSYAETDPNRIPCQLTRKASDSMYDKYQLIPSGALQGRGKLLCMDVIKDTWDPGSFFEPPESFITFNEENLMFFTH